MGVIGRVAKVITYSSAAGIGSFFFLTRKSTIQPLPSTDPILQSSFYRRFNPERNPTVQDNCIRFVPLSQIDPSLLEKGKLLEAFSAAFWSGSGSQILSTARHGHIRMRIMLMTA